MSSSQYVRTRRLYIASLILVLFLGLAVAAQEDPDPNSPTPVLLTETQSTRALVQRANLTRRTSIPVSGQTAFAPNTKVTVYVANIALMDGEGANAFRIDAEDEKGHHFQFPVLGIEPVKGDVDGVFAFTLLLRDEIGFWEPPAADGDLLIAVTWRGLASNRARLGLGVTGGAIKDDPTSVPMPLATLQRKRIKTFRSRTASASFTGEPTAEYGAYRFSGDRKRFLEQATFGPTVAADQRLRRIGIRTWLAEQFDAPYPSLNNPYPDIPLKSTNTDDSTLGCGAAPVPTTITYRACIRDFYSMYPVQKWFYTEALYGDSQLRHRVAWALAQMWVISGVDTQQSSWMIAYHKILSDNAFGNYRKLMKDMTLNPGMGNYLDMARSTKANPNAAFYSRAVHAEPGRDAAARRVE